MDPDTLSSYDIDYNYLKIIAAWRLHGCRR